MLTIKNKKKEKNSRSFPYSYKKIKINSILLIVERRTYMQTKSISSYDGTKIYYKICGKGKPLIFLHGNAGSPRVFKKQIPLFANFFQLVFMESRDHGRSSNNSTTLNFEQMARDLACICSAENFKTIDLLGYSDGAMIAMWFAHLFPQKVHKMILNAGNITPDGLKVRPRFGATLLYYGLKCLSFIPLTRKYLRIVHLIIVQCGLNWQDLEKISTPSLVIAGENDIIKTAHTKKIAHSIPNSQLVIIPSGNHRMLKTNASLFNKYVLDFLHP
ncbi:hypothetical protein CBF30_02580 [Vagococcus entomophilus]|uniref:AB hydrolase-1 domain-containing protein n=2 Tax=Vagococcus entomophilus TaxID=1160095 RepID=A0A430AJC5_9ENTE|nr:hypothetical protein CBF30_02580 [Vagococcus entomophilus]